MAPQKNPADSQSENSVSSSSSTSNAEITLKNPTLANLPIRLLANLAQYSPLLHGLRTLIPQWEAILDSILRVVRNSTSLIAKHPWATFSGFLGVFIAANPLAMLGFGTLGPIAGSLAAAIQSAMGNVAAGSVFAWFQSLGMTLGLALPGIGLAILIVACAYMAWIYWKEEKEKEE